MPGSDKPNAMQTRLAAALDRQALTQHGGPSERVGDPFPAAFAAARGTVSPELDLSADVDEPAATDRTGDAGRLRPGA